MTIGSRWVVRRQFETPRRSTTRGTLDGVPKRGLQDPARLHAERSGDATRGAWPDRPEPKPKRHQSDPPSQR